MNQPTHGSAETATPRWIVERRAREEATDGPFRKLCAPYLGLGFRVPAADRLERAQWALSEYRQVRNQHTNMGGEKINMPVRIVADTLASQIGAAAGDGQDPATIAWVLAGLRCPSRPFCTGCAACQTITSPTRPAERIDSARV